MLAGADGRRRERPGSPHGDHDASRGDEPRREREKGVDADRTGDDDGGPADHLRVGHGFRACLEHPSVRQGDGPDRLPEEAGPPPPGLNQPQLEIGPSTREDETGKAGPASHIDDQPGGGQVSHRREAVDDVLAKEHFGIALARQVYPAVPESHELEEPRQTADCLEPKFDAKPRRALGKEPRLRGADSHPSGR